MNQKKWLRAAGHHRSVLNKRQYGAALSRSMLGARLLLITSAVKGEGGREGGEEHTVAGFLCTTYFPQQASHALCLFGSSWVKVQLSLCSSQDSAPFSSSHPCCSTVSCCPLLQHMDIRAEGLPKQPWGKPWVTCSAPSADPALSWRLDQRIPNTSSNPNNYIILMNYKNVLTFFTGLCWATGVWILNK